MKLAVYLNRKYPQTMIPVSCLYAEIMPDSHIERARIKQRVRSTLKTRHIPDRIVKSAFVEIVGKFV